MELTQLEIDTIKSVIADIEERMNNPRYDCDDVYYYIDRLVHYLKGVLFI